MEEEKIRILGIETSCDETAAAVVENGRIILSNVIYSQIDIHTEYGGVVPEIASRKHVEKIGYVIESALTEAKLGWEEIAAVAVTYGPGLVGALLVGVNTAKALAYGKQKPLVGVHHIEGHICANFLAHPTLEPPFMCLVASGGHSHLVLVKEHGSYEIIGRTRDDAAGEAFDKVARSIGLGYPGGPKIDKIAKQGDPDAIAFPKAVIEEAKFDFSFSGVKSAVLNYLNRLEMMGKSYVQADVAASFQKAVTEVLTEHTVLAAREYGMRQVVLAGGVAANSALQEKMTAACAEAGLTLFIPPLGLCTDNAAMIAAAGYFDYSAGIRDGYHLNAVPGLKIGTRNAERLKA
ncbi:MAG: tRNA (adenosine(37)-N6)-threonylcarbamoyltransferase complex transferase subunit TsaD [Lachnospiraceae bacterium]|nr:tRNA (adenosine(37)-N6)-threonylcarbamoyltransferase complex transferase subunit TsaD [Lachnospiraceae bacterium]